MKFILCETYISQLVNVIYTKLLVHNRYLVMHIVSTYLIYNKKFDWQILLKLGCIYDEKNLVENKRESSVVGVLETSTTTTHK